MLIGEVVKVTGFSKDTIRFYEKKKLIVLYRGDRRGNNYKEYSESIVQKLLSIKKLKGLGFTLNEIAEILELIQDNLATCDNITNKIDDKVVLIRLKIKELESLEQQLITGSQNCVNTCGMRDSTNCEIVI